jgi:hypothetical protein
VSVDDDSAHPVFVPIRSTDQLWWRALLGLLLTLTASKVLNSEHISRQLHWVNDLHSSKERKVLGSSQINALEKGRLKHRLMSI